GFCEIASRGKGRGCVLLQRRMRAHQWRVEAKFTRVDKAEVGAELGSRGVPRQFWQLAERQALDCLELAYGRHLQAGERGKYLEVVHLVAKVVAQCVDACWCGSDTQLVSDDLLVLGSARPEVSQVMPVQNAVLIVVGRIVGDGVAHLV